MICMLGAGSESKECFRSLDAIEANISEQQWLGNMSERFASQRQRPSCVMPLAIIRHLLHDEMQHIGGEIAHDSCAELRLSVGSLVRESSFLKGSHGDLSTGYPSHNQTIVRCSDSVIT
jgi:hypothetical protein